MRVEVSVRLEPGRLRVGEACIRVFNGLEECERNSYV